MLLILVIAISFAGFAKSQNGTSTIAPTGVPKYILQARFSMGGLRGGILFVQKEKNQPLEIKVQMDTFSGHGDFGIYSNPMIYNQNAKDSCNSAVVGNQIPNGNLTEKHGPFTFKMTLTNDKLKAYGRDSILGRTVVIRHQSSSELWGCATVLPFDKSVLYASTKFKGLIAGEVRFLQNLNEDKSDVLVTGDLYYTDGRSKPSDNHGWFISSSSSSDLNDCSKLTSVLKSGSLGNGTCSIYEPQSCDMGDLSSKLENISIGIANTERKKFRLIDTNLAVSKIIGHALVIRDLSGAPVACANVLRSGQMSLSASFSASQHDGVFGSITFKQDSPYHPTIINYNLVGLEKRAKGFHVHRYPIPQPAPKNPCADSIVSGHLNPYGIVKDSSYPADGSNNTMDKYELGDLSGKFGNLAGLSSLTRQNIGVQLSLFGRYSILNRALVIHRNDTGGSRWICSNILPASSPKQLSATANFTTTSGLKGMVNLVQFMMSEGIMTDTAITVQLSYKESSSKTTKNHNWHVHIEAVGNDWKSEINDRCKSVGPHYNPYKVNTQGNYSKECSPSTPLRCELGDLNGKQTKYDIGGGKRYFLDSNTPLFGITSVIGRSFTFHTENAGAPRLACADIIPDSIAAVAQIDLSVPEDVPFIKSDVQFVISQALNISQWQISYVKHLPSSKPCKIISFFIIDNRQIANAYEYRTKIEKLYKEKKLKKYTPCSKKTTSGCSWLAVPSTFAILIISFVLFFVTRQ